MKFRNKFTIASSIAAALISLAAAAVFTWGLDAAFMPDLSGFQRFLLLSSIFYLNFALFFFIFPLTSAEFRKKVFDFNFADISESDGFFPFQKKYKNLINRIPVGIYRTTKEGKILEANKELAKIFGFDTVEELKRHNVYEFFETEAQRNGLVEKKLRNNTFIDETIRMKSKDGRRIWVRDLGRIIYDKKGHPEAIDGILQDITARKNAEEELIRSEKRYSRLFENLHDIFFQLDPEGRILRISPSIEQVTGFSPAEAEGMNIRNFMIQGSDIDNFFKILNKNGKVNSFLINVKGKNGNRVHLSINARYFENRDLNISGIEGIATDVTNEIRSRNILNTLYNISRALDSSDNLNELYFRIHVALSRILDVKNIFIADFDDDTGIIEYSYLIDKKGAGIEEESASGEKSLAAKLFNRKRSIILQEDDIKYLPEGFSIKPKSWIGVPLKLRNSITGAIGIYDYDEAGYYGDDDMHLLTTVCGQIALAIDSKKVEMERKYQYSFMQNLIDTIPSPIYYKDIIDKKYLGCNKAFEDFTGLKKSRIIGSSAAEIFDAGLARMISGADNELIRNSPSFESEPLEKRFDTGNKNILSYHSFYHGAEGEISGLVGIMIDVTDKVLAQEELKVAKEHAELIFKVSPSCIFTINDNYDITAWNERSEITTGYKANEVLGRSCSILTAGRAQDLFPLFMGPAAAPLLNYETTLKTKEGADLVVSLNADFLRDVNGAVIGGIISFDDITRRKRIEEALFWQAGVNSAIADISKSILSLESLDKMSAVISNNIKRLTNAEAAFVGYIDGDFIYFTSFEKDIFPNAEIIEDKMKMPADYGIMAPFIKRQEPVISNDVISDGFIPQEKAADTYLRKIVAAPAMAQEDMQGMIAVINRQGDFTYQDLEVIERMASIFAIAYQRVLAENEIRSALQKEQELSELKSRFILMVSHEYRTPLTSIMLSTELLEDYGDQFDKKNKKEHYGRIKSSVDTMTKLMEDIITYNKIDTGHIDFMPQFVDIKEFCIHILNEMQLVFKEKCVIIFNFKGENIIAYVDDTLLRQIFTNLLSNACKYSTGRSEIQFLVDVRDGEIEFKVKDDGIGIPGEDRKNLFEPFFRAGNVGTISGTGLGLSIVKNAVEIHKGRISYESEVGKGTTFRVVIPVLKKKEAKTAGKSEIRK